MAAAPDDKIKILEEKVNALPEESRGDLTIKIKSKDPSQPGAISMPRLVCTMAAAHITHVANPELWLPQLMGGGRFELDVYLPGNNAAPAVSGFVFDLQGDPRSFPDHDVVDVPSWKGPKKITYPMKPAVKPSTTAIPTFIASPQSVSTNVAPQTSSSGPTSSGGVPPQYLEEVRRMQAEFAAHTQMLQQQIADERRRAEEERHRREVEAIRAAQQAELAALKADLDRIKSAPPPTPPPPPPEKPSIADMIRDILPAAAPLITAYLNSQAEERRRAEERQARAEERTAELIKEMRSRPVIDPEVGKLLERLSAEQQPASVLVQQSAQATATMAAQMMTMVQTMAESLQGPEESPVIKVVREVGGTLKDIVAAGAQQAQPRAPRRLPKSESVDTPGAMPQQGAGLHGYDPAASGAPLGILARIREMLLAHEDPDKVAQAAVEAFPTEEFQRALRASNMEADKMFERLMTPEWVEANGPYAYAFGQAFMKRFAAVNSAAVSDADEEVEEEAT
jgi:hypothetical protein